MSELILPRLMHYPADAPYSSGPDFAELALSAGLELDPWQCRDLDCGLRETLQGKWASFQNTVIVPRQNGKDAEIEALILGWLFITGERLVGVSAHEYKTAMESFRRVIALIENTDDLRRQVKKVINTNGEEGVELLDGRRARWLARSKGAGRGFSFDKLVWNEAYALTAPQVSATLPAMSARPNPQLWLFSSPPLESGTAEPLYAARRAALAGAPGMMYIDYGHDAELDQIGPCQSSNCSHQAGRSVGCILDDPKVWARTNPAHPGRVTVEAIERERVAMDPVGFARERIGLWPPDLSEGFTIITKAQWEALVDERSGSDEWDTETLLPSMGTVLKIVTELAGGPPPTELLGRPVLAVDVSPRSAGAVRASISLAQRRVDEKRHLELIMNGPGTAWVLEIIGQFQAKNGKCVVVVDPGSPAGSLIPDLEEAGIIVQTMTSRDVASAFGMIYDAATGKTEQDRSIAHLGQAEITLALGGAGKRPIGDGHAWDRRTATTDITPLVSITHALWGVSKGLEPAAPPAPWAVYA